MTAPTRSMPDENMMILRGESCGKTTAPIVLIDEKYEVYRIVTDIDALHEAFRDRVEDLDTTRLSIDDAGGLQGGYASKLLCDPPMKKIGNITLPKMLKATGMALVLVIDDERFALVKDKLTKRQRPMRPNGSIKRPAWLITREASQKMQDLRNKKLSPRQRKMIAKKAAKARWSKKRGPIARRAMPCVGSPADLDS